MHKLLLLAVVGCLALPVLAHAESEGMANGKKPTRKVPVPARSVQKHNSNRVVVYITKQPRTGSQIPMTYRQYNGRIDSASNPAVYGSDAINATGAIDVAGVLNRIDPSITTRR